jgi:sulfatase maturation enzyme AslB (radical SAM superfamily)
MLSKCVVLDKKYTVVGDAVLNAAATISTTVRGKPKSIRVKNRLLSEALKRSGISVVGRHDYHELAEIYEGIVGYAYLNLGFTFESLTKNLVDYLNSGDEGEAYINFLINLWREIKQKDVVLV